jgi:hypothetical protein
MKSPACAIEDDPEQFASAISRLLDSAHGPAGNALRAPLEGLRWANGWPPRIFSPTPRRRQTCSRTLRLGFGPLASASQVLGKNA